MLSNRRSEGIAVEDGPRLSGCYVSQSICRVPAPQSNPGPDEFDNAERPCSREESVGAGEKAAKSKQQDELLAASFQGIHDHHE
jgi:hypothetical protein